jgi:hypothetical protein
MCHENYPAIQRLFLDAEGPQLVGLDNNWWRVLVAIRLASTPPY